MCAKLATRKDGLTFPCGQCMNCRINRQRNWQARLLLEAASHANGIFVTLTFRDSGVMPILRRSDIRQFIHSLRTIFPTELRYFAVGEYGGETGRAHYHLHLFSDRPVSSQHLVEAWPFGRIHIGDCEPASLDYTLGYLLKDVGSKPEWPVQIRYPEFRSFSKGIGRKAFPELSSKGVLPRSFRVFGREWPIGRYYRSLAKEKGVAVDERAEIKLEKFEAAEMSSMLGRSGLSAEEVAKLYHSYVENRQKKSDLARRKAIRDAYKQAHGHTKRKRHETL